MTKSLLFLLLALACSPAFAQGASFLAVRGEASIEVVPDQFPLRLEITADGFDVAKSQGRVEELTRNVLSQARSLGLDDRAIQVGSISIRPQSRYDEKTEQSIFTGNRYSRVIRLEFDDLEKLRRQVAATPPGENLEISTEAFQLSNSPEVRRRLLKDAIASAHATAEVLAAGIERKLLRAQTISTSPMALTAGSYINAIDVSGTESTSILTAEQIAKVPAPRDITSVALLAPGSIRNTEIAMEKGALKLRVEVYVVYGLGD